MSVAEVRSLLLLTDSYDSFYIHDNTAVHYFTLYILYTLICVYLCRSVRIFLW